MASIALIFWLILLPQSGLAETCTGKVFKEGERGKSPVYLFQRTEAKVASGTRVESVYSNPDGTEAVRETVIIGLDGKIQLFIQDRKQLQERGELVVNKGKVELSYTREGKTEKDEEDLSSKFTVGPWLVPTVVAQWDLLMKGETVDVRFAVLDRKETVGFKVFKEEELKRDGKELVLIKMKPSSFVIAALVKPLLFTFDRATRSLIELKGRTIPKIQIDGKWKDLDAEIVYECVK